jgi:hypothetical protein
MVRRYPDGDTLNERRAVRRALWETGQLRDGEARLRLVQMVLLEGTHTLSGAAVLLSCSDHTAQRYHADFLRAVGKNFCCKGLE